MRLAPFISAVVDDSACTVGVTRPLTVQGLTPADVSWCALLVEHLPLPPPPSLTCQRLWDELMRRAWLVETSTADLHVRVFGAGSTGTAVGVALAQAGVTMVSFDDHRARHHADAWAYAATVPAEVGAARAAAWTVRDAARSVRTAGLERPAQVHVITGQGRPALGPVLDCMAHEIPHLIITGLDDAVQVGPWVVPGRTPCWWCWQPPLVADPQTDRMAAMASAHHPVCPPWQGWTVAGLAARIVTRWRDHQERPDHAVVVTAGGELRRLPVPPVRECGCGYPDGSAGVLATISKI